MTALDPSALSAWRRYKPSKRKTTEIYEFAITAYSEWCERNDVDVLDPTLQQAWDFTHELSSGRQGSTVTTYLYGLRRFFHAVREAGMTRNGVFENVAVGFQPKGKSHYARSEYERLLDVAVGDDRVFLLLVGDVGVRPYQALKATWADVTHEHNLRVGADDYPLTGRAAQAIHFLPHRNGPLLSFRSQTRMRQRMQRLCDRAAVKYRAIDVLRSFAA